MQKKDHRGLKTTNETILCILFLIIFVSTFVGLLINKTMHIVSASILTLTIIGTIIYWIYLYKNYKDRND